jgi:biopolymer transport protein ExbD
MRRFSQRNSFVTLSEINITPLLDLAFVLLIIFVITHPMIEQSMRLNLPQVGRQRSLKPDPNNVRMVEISQSGEMRFSGRKVTLHQFESELGKQFKANPDLILAIRSDKTAPFEHFAKVSDICQRLGMSKVSIKVAPIR